MDLLEGGGTWCGVLTIKTSHRKPPQTLKTGLSTPRSSTTTSPTNSSSTTTAPPTLSPRGRTPSRPVSRVAGWATGRSGARRDCDGMRLYMGRGGKRPQGRMEGEEGEGGGLACACRCFVYIEEKGIV